MIEKKNIYNVIYIIYWEYIIQYIYIHTHTHIQIQKRIL